MNLKTVLYDYSKISVDGSQEQKDFKKEIDIGNAIYLFYKDNDCLYIGQTGVSLQNRCYKNSPNHAEKDWFKEANKIHIIQVEDLDGFNRQNIESTFITAYRPENNKKA